MRRKWKATLPECIMSFLVLFCIIASGQHRVNAEPVIIYPVIPFEGELIPSNPAQPNKLLDKATKTILSHSRKAQRELAHIDRPAEDIVREDEQPVEEWTYLGTWTATAYCGCPECCGEYSSGYTASGTWATEGRTIACNALPMGTEVLINGDTYIVEDTGYTPYGDAWVDIFFESHEAALTWGVRPVDIYIRA